MGSGASFLSLSNSSTVVVKHNRPIDDSSKLEGPPSLTLFTMSSAPHLSSGAMINSLLVYNQELHVDKALVKVCDGAWQKIASANLKSQTSDSIGLFAFCDNFFMIMSDIDIENIAIPRFQPRSVSSLPNRNALLLKIVRYMLSIPNDKFSSKSKIRRLGRAHATRNIREPHFKIFAEAFIRTLVSIDGNILKNEIRAWAQLICFFVVELTVENVSFVTHHSHHQQSAMCCSSFEPESCKGSARLPDPQNPDIEVYVGSCDPARDRGHELLRIGSIVDIDNNTMSGTRRKYEENANGSMQLEDMEEGISAKKLPSQVGKN